MGTDAPDGSIVITPKEFYDGYRQDIADIKKAVEPLTGLHDDVTELKRRVAVLESKVVWASGFAAAVGLAGGWLIPNVIK